MDLKNTLKWDKFELLKALAGVAIFCISINLFIIPNHLYNDGLLGISQLIRTYIFDTLKISFDFDIAGIIYFIFNIPLFIISYKQLSKGFLTRTLLIIFLQTIFLTIIPIPKSPLVNNNLTTILIGSILCGIGSGMCLSSGASGGGTDIIGLLISSKNRNLSVGRINICINIFVYAICGILYGIEIMIYSIVYTVIVSITVDKTHQQNICSQAFIFTKEDPNKIINFIKDKLNRDVTYWEAIGGYDNTKTYICYTVLSKYEQLRLERNLKYLDSNAFISKTSGVGVYGDFKKVYGTLDNN